MEKAMKENTKYENATIESIKAELEELDKALGRQHGRAGKTFDDPEKEKRRLWNNLQSRKSRNNRREIEKKREKSYRESLGIVDDEDEYGIRPIDERRYIACFHSGYIDAPVYRKYVQRMTGLSLKQVYLLQQETGLKPYPAVTEKVADKDQKIRDREGIYI
jgi:hypothetical protein